MRIGIYTPYLDTLAGGEKYILSIAAALANKHDVFLFWNPSEEQELKKKIKTKLNIEIPQISFVNNIFTPQTSLVARLFESQKYDYILVLSDGSIPIVLSKLLLHFQTPMPWIRPSFLLKLKMNRVRAVICNSQFTKKYIDKEFGKESQVIYPAVTITKQHIEKKNMILHVGRYGVQNSGSSAKKQEFMADTFKKLVDNGISEWKMTFVISYKEDAIDDVSTFRERIKNYPIELIENPTNDILWKTYNQAKIYWHASGIGEDLEKHPGRAEHFGISTVEAMGCGAVPIVINAGGQPEIVEDGVNGLLWDSQETLMSKTKTVIEDEAMRKTLAASAQKRATVFSADAFEKNWERLIV